MNGAYVEGRVVSHAETESLVLVRSYHPCNSIDVVRVIHAESPEILLAFAEGRDVGLGGRLRARSGGVVLEVTDVHVLQEVQR